VKHLAGDGVVERLGAFGLAMLVEQGNVGELDLGPQRLVALGFRKAGEELVDRFLDAAVVHEDALAGKAAHLAPGGALIKRLGAARRLAEQPVVAIEAGEDRPRDLGRAVYAAASLAFFCESKNCSSSVDPCSAVVEAARPVTTWVISSK